jgi:pimeloyl-ACP methyl ester carboxylesterase
MIPLHFGSSDRRLFGVYTPAPDRRKRRGVVICNPWGAEALRAHRSLKRLADLLAQCGLDVLRFDYSGTGDSFGSGMDTRLTTWIADAELAIEEIAGAAGSTRVAVLGLRLGSYVAAAAAARRASQVDRVVLWEPMFSGSEHLRDLLAQYESTGRAQSNGILNLGGFPLPTRFREELTGASLSGLPGSAARVLVVHSASASPPSAHAATLAGGELTIVGVEAPPCWVEEREFGAGAVPVNLLRRVTEWLA